MDRLRTFSQKGKMRKIKKLKQFLGAPKFNVEFKAKNVTGVRERKLANWKTRLKINQVKKFKEILKKEKNIEN